MGRVESAATVVNDAEGQRPWTCDLNSDFDRTRAPVPDAVEDQFRDEIVH